MVPDTDSLLALLGSLVGDLTPTSAAGPAALEDARRAAASAVRSGQPTHPIPAAFSAIPDDLVALLNPSNLPESDLMVFRRSLPILSTQLTASLPSWAAGQQIERSFGPFRDALGRDIWIDVFRRVRQVHFVRSAGAAPFLKLPISLLTHLKIKTLTRYTLPPGSIWFSSPLLCPTAPAGTYTGLRIRGGTLEFSQPISVVNDEVIVPPAVTCQLSLELEVMPAPTGSGDGGDARNSQVGTPEHIRMIFNASGAVLESAESARLLTYGFDTTLTYRSGTPVYLAEFNRMAVPFTANAASFAITSVQSRLFQPSGSAPISEAAWGLSVALIDPAQLGEASGSGALMLQLNSGIQSTWLGQTEPIELGSCWLIVDPTRLALVAHQAKGYGVIQHPLLWNTSPRNQFDLRWNYTFPLSFFAQADGSEAVLTTSALEASLAQPVDVRGERLALQIEAVQVAFIANAQGTFLWLLSNISPPAQPPALGFALMNALLKTTFPNLFAIYAPYDGTHCKSGALLLRYGLFGLVPTLPDPYAANYDSLPRLLDQPGSTVISLITWQPNHAVVDFRLLTNNLQTLSGGQPQMQTSVLPVPTSALEYRQSASTVTDAVGGALAFEQQHGLILLDVSTNIDQMGVAFYQAHGNDDLVTIGTALNIQDLQLQVRGQNLLLLTLPAVQWEAVYTEGDPDPTFPERLGFANSGVPSLMSVPSVTLVPTHPAAVLERLVKNFTEPDPLPTMLRFTLPFGIIAQARLAKSTTASPRGATLQPNRPRHDNYEGAHQLRIDAVDSSLASDESPSLSGFTVQLPIGQPGFRSVLGNSATTIFNTYLGAGGTRPLIPVTRLDLSGYGESLFSNWRNPYSNPTQDAVAVAQARFDVLIGRTSFEVVQVRSYLFPYAPEMVRTITLERRNNAVIKRHDSGWKAVSDGTFVFTTAPAIQTHPGVVRRITNISDVRETGQVLTIDGYQLAAVRFNGDLEIDGAATLVPVKDQLGYIQITAGGLMPSTSYANLIKTAGPLGGPLDAGIQVGSGGQVMRLHRVGIGVTAGLAGPEFVMTAWGTPVFPGGGEWSVLSVSDPTAAPQFVPREQGLPLIRAGIAGSAPALTSPYRFADPEDLTRPDNPDRDYGILHATNTQRVFFARPKIEATDTSRITSTQVPVLADPYSLATALGPFPELPRGIAFPSSTWALFIQAGQYRLELPSNTFPAGSGRRTLKQAGSVKSDVDYTAASITYQVDTAQPVPWHFRLDNVAKIVNTSALGDVLRLTTNIVAAADRATAFENPNMVMGGAFTVIQDLLTILADFGITGTMRADMTNEWSLKIQLKVPFVDATGEDLQIPPLVPIPDIKFKDSGISVSEKVAPTNDEAELELEGRPMFSVKSVPGLYVGGIIKFSIKISTSSGTTYTLLLGFSISYEIEIASWIKLEGSFSLYIFGLVGDNVLGFGAGFLLEVSLDLKIIAISLKLEGKLAVIDACRGTPTETVFGAAKLTFAVEVSICLVFSISFEVETETHNVMRGPGEPTCMLPDVL